MCKKALHHTTHRWTITTHLAVAAVCSVMQWRRIDMITCLELRAGQHRRRIQEKPCRIDPTKQSGSAQSNASPVDDPCIPQHCHNFHALVLCCEDHCALTTRGSSLTLTPRSSSTLTASAYPPRAATSNSVYPPNFWIPESTPTRRSSFSTSACPLKAAMYEGVSPSVVRLLGLAPASNKISTPPRFRFHTSCEGLNDPVQILLLYPSRH